MPRIVPTLTAIKCFGWRNFPGLYHTLQRRFGYPAHYTRVAHAVVRRYGLRVQDGPFAGMHYEWAVAGSAYTPKILGCYEQEVHALLQKALARDYRVVVDIGCAEGYYAVGLALRCPQAQVYAYDGSPHARGYCERLADRNGVAERVHVRGFCSPQELAALPLSGALVVCDVDGYEEDLLRPDLAPELLAADLLVELHEPVRPGLTQTVLSRFCNTHTITVVDAVERDPRDHPLVGFLKPGERALALTEGRPPGQQYALLQAYRSQDG